MIPHFPHFKQLEFSDKDHVERHLMCHNPSICELNFTNLIIWKDFDRPQLTKINDNLCILINPLNEPPYFLEPLGKNKIIETINTCLLHAKSISRASEELISRIPHKEYKIICIRNHFDYIYLVKEMKGLKGKKYDGKRNHIKNFVRHFPDYKFAPLTCGDKDKALELFLKWFSVKKETQYFPRLAFNAQKTAIEESFKYFNKLNLLGSTIRHNNKILAFIVGSKTNKGMVSAHFLYSDPEIKGISQTMLWEACDKTFSDFEFINLEQDLGIAGIRKSKLSYHPHKILKKYQIELKERHSCANG